MNELKAEESKVVVYGHKHCPQALLLIAALDKHNVDYEWRDVMGDDPNYKDELRQLANGNLSVPTLIFPDGTVMIEPWPGKVLKKLDMKKAGRTEQFFQKLLGKVS